MRRAGRGRRATHINKVIVFFEVMPMPQLASASCYDYDEYIHHGAGACSALNELLFCLRPRSAAGG